MSNIKIFYEILINSNLKSINSYTKKYRYHLLFDSFEENLVFIKKIIDKNETFRLDTLIKYSNINITNYIPIIFTYSIHSDKIIKWLYLNNYFNENCVEEAFFESCINNNLKMMKWLLSISKNKIDYHKNDDNLFRETCKKNSVDSIIFLCKNTEFNLKIESYYNDEFIDEVPFHFFCRHNYIEIAKEYINNFDFDINYKDNEAIALSCQENSLEMAKLCYELGGDILVKNYWCLLVSVQRENLQIIEWIYSLNKIDFNINEDYFFRLACTLGKIETAKLLHSFGNVDVHTNDEIVFSSACLSGDLELAKWLYEIGNFNINKDDDIIFRYLCQLGYIDILKWIYSISEINIHYDKENAFRSAVFHGHNEVVKWIYSLGNVKIKSNNHEAFMTSCESNNIELAKWFSEINHQEYVVDIEDDVITNFFVNKIIYIFGKVQLEEDKITECPICYTNKPQIITDCQHQYCKSCFINYVNSKDLEYEEIPCPYCRKKEIKIFELNSGLNI